MIGEASGTMDSLFFNMMLVGNVISGLLAQWLGLRLSIAGLGLLIVAVASLAWINFRVKTARQPDAAFLDRIPAFANVSEEVREWAGRQMVKHDFPAGELIIRQGEVGDDFYTIAKGKVRVDVKPNGEVVTRELGPGEFFGEIALLQDVPRTATVTAIEPVTTYSLSREAFQELQRRAGEFKESLLETAASRLQEDANIKMALASLS
jgi:Cyclic nucleotide-binding domain